MLDEIHEMIRKLARRFAETELRPYANMADETGRYPQELVRKVADCGFMGIAIPREYGGAGGDFRSVAVVTEEFCRVDASASSLIMPSTLSGAPYMLFGTEAQKQEYLRPMAEGTRIGAFALTEPGAGSDTSRISTTAEKIGEQYILNGRKCFITHGPDCTNAVVFARTDSKATGTKGITAFTVDVRSPGFSKGKTEDTMGIHGAPICDLIFENVRVPKENMLGEEGSGHSIALSCLSMGRVAVASQALGVAQSALDEAVKYSKERVQFGKPICRHQNTAFKLADMDTKTQAARLLVYDAAYRLDTGMEVVKQAAMAKYYASETANRVAYDALQIHGGYGYMRSYPIERIYRDARILTIYEGTSEIQKMVISGVLLK